VARREHRLWSWDQANSMWLEIGTGPKALMNESLGRRRRAAARLMPDAVFMLQAPGDLQPYLTPAEYCTHNEQCPVHLLHKPVPEAVSGRNEPRAVMADPPCDVLFYGEDMAHTVTRRPGVVIECAPHKWRRTVEGGRHGIEGMQKLIDMHQARE
jgi:hypothetical protein